MNVEGLAVLLLLFVGLFLVCIPLAFALPDNLYRWLLPIACIVGIVIAGLVFGLIVKGGGGGR